MSQEDSISSLEEISGRLRRNEEGYTTLQLQLNPGWEAADVDAVTEALIVNNTLQGIEFFGILADDDVNEAVGRLFASFGGLPNLRSLIVSGYCAGMVRALGRVVHEATKLETLNITYVQLDGGHEDFRYFTESIQQHSSLSDFRIVDCQLPERLRGADVLPMGIMDMIMDVMPTLASLREVDMSPIEKTSLGPISCEAITSLCRSLNLRKLSLAGFAEFCPGEALEDSSTHLEAMAEALQMNETLRELNIQSSFSKSQCNALAGLLNSNETLEALGIQFVGEKFDNEKNSIEIAEALRTNATLKYLTFRGPICPKLSSETMEEFFDSLSINTSIRRLQFLPSPAEQNKWTSKIDLFLKLNQRGREEFLRAEGRTKEQWLDKLLEVHDDLDCLFYFLSVSPSHCSM